MQANGNRGCSCYGLVEQDVMLRMVAVVSLSVGGDNAVDIGGQGGGPWTQRRVIELCVHT